MSGLQQYFENRLKVLAAEKESGKNPYPHKFQGINHLSVPEFVKKYGVLESGAHSEDEVSLTGKFLLHFELVFLFISILNKSCINNCFLL